MLVLRNAIDTMLTTAKGALRLAEAVPKNVEGWLDKSQSKFFILLDYYLTCCHCRLLLT